MNSNPKNHDQQNIDATAFALDQLSGDSADPIREQITDDAKLQQDVNETVRLAGLVEHANAIDLPDNIAGLEQQMEEAFAQASNNKVAARTHVETSGWSGRRWLAIAATTLLVGGGAYLLTATQQHSRQAAKHDVPPRAEQIDELFSDLDTQKKSGTLSVDGRFDLGDIPESNLEGQKKVVDELYKAMNNQNSTATVVDNTLRETELDLKEGTKVRALAPETFNMNLHNSAGAIQNSFDPSGTTIMVLDNDHASSKYRMWGPTKLGAQFGDAYAAPNGTSAPIASAGTGSEPLVPGDQRFEKAFYRAGLRSGNEKLGREMRIQLLESQLEQARSKLHKTTEELDAQQKLATKGFADFPEYEKHSAKQEALVGDLEVQLRQLTEDVAEQRAEVFAMTKQVFDLQSVGEKSVEQVRTRLESELKLANEEYDNIRRSKDTTAATIVGDFAGEDDRSALSAATLQQHQARAGELDVKLKELNEQISTTKQAQKLFQSTIAKGANEQDVMDWIVNKSGMLGFDPDAADDEFGGEPENPVRDEINRLETVKTELAKKFGSEHPEVRFLEEKISGFELWVENNPETKNVSPEEKMARFSAALERQINQLNGKYADVHEANTFHKARAKQLEEVDHQLAAKQQHINLIREKMELLKEYQPVSFYYNDFRDRKDRDPNSNEQYELPPENNFQRPVGEQARSTFSVDVDTASYSNARRFINNRQLPPANAVRVEEFVNYFAYGYATPTDAKPFAVNMEVAQCPWNEAHKLLRVGIKGKEIPQDDRPPSNLVFLIDVSGSMKDHNKLPLLQRSMLMLVDKLTENDRVTIVTYAGNAGLRMEPTSGDQKEKIRGAISGLSAEGSTHGSAGIRLAYQKATETFIPEGTNRVILATDGDLNVGVTADDELVRLIKDKAETGVFLSVLGFGTGNLKDAKLEKLADNGNGQYSYIDSIREARKVLVEDMTGSLITIAKDVKLQIEFNPAEIAGYRLIGYENRALRNQDFDDDFVDAGEIGSGHTVTALYELIPVDARRTLAEPEESTTLKYQQLASKDHIEDEPQPTEEKFELTDAARSGEWLTLALRYKEPQGTESTRVDFVVRDSDTPFDEASQDFRFAASVASYGMLLRHSRHAGTWRLDNVENAAALALGEDSKGHRAEFIDLVRQTRAIVGH